VSSEGFDEYFSVLGARRVEHASILAQVALSEDPALSAWENPRLTAREARGFLDILSRFPTHGESVLVTKTF
jgi:hypothetical protein